ncbi:MAG: glycosyltransferase family 4 protein, partial [Flavobacterium sp.]
NYKGLKGRKVHVVRPPFFLESQPVDISHYQLPSRYFIHFGSIGALKGSDTIAEALPIIWEKYPDFRMVWAGKERQKGVMQEYKKLWGKNAEKVVWFDGLVKNELYAALKNAEVSVLPSRVDNLPNTVVESLFLGIPVIGSNGASIDELVEPLRNGALVEIGDVEQLAGAMMDAWTKNKNWLPNGFQKTKVLNDFNPDIAGENIIKLHKEYTTKRK